MPRCNLYTNGDREKYVHSSPSQFRRTIDTRIRRSEFVQLSLSECSSFDPLPIEVSSMPRTGRVLWIRRSQFFQALGRSVLLNLRKTSGLAVASTKYSTFPSIKASIERTAFFANKISCGCEESFMTASATISVCTTHGPTFFSVSKSRACPSSLYASFLFQGKLDG